MLALVLWLLVLPDASLAQQAERIGTVLVVEGTAEVRAQNAQNWEPLRFRDAVFLNDTVRTPEASKLKVLLRDDSIMTLSERSEMQFTEFLLTAGQRRTIVRLAIGKIRVLTTRLFGSGSTTEVETPNAVAGVRGSENITGTDQNTTTSLCASGDCFIANLDRTDVRDVPEGNVARQVDAIFNPVIAVPTPQQRTAIVGGTSATEQVPSEVNPGDQPGPTGPGRGGDIIQPPPTTDVPVPPPPPSGLGGPGQLGPQETRGPLGPALLEPPPFTADRPETLEKLKTRLKITGTIQ
jgi:hypothetical protein